MPYTLPLTLFTDSVTYGSLPLFVTLSGTTFTINPQLSTTTGTYKIPITLVQGTAPPN